MTCQHQVRSNQPASLWAKSNGGRHFPPFVFLHLARNPFEANDRARDEYDECDDEAHTPREQSADNSNSAQSAVGRIELDEKVKNQTSRSICLAVEPDSISA